MPGAQLADLTARAGDRILVALGAALRVVDRPEPFRDLVAFLEDLAVGVKLRLRLETVGPVVEPGRRFGECRSCPLR